MEIFSKNHKVAKLISHNYHLLPVLNRFEIKLGLKDKTVEEICIEKNISTDFFLAIVNTYHNEDYFPEDELLSFSPLEIISYLRKTHQYYIEYVLPKLDSLLKQLIQSSSSISKDLQMVDVFYKKYKQELTLHINDEEERVFPYVRNLAETGEKPNNYSIHSFEKEHTNVDEKLNDLKNLVIKYIKPDYDENICNEFLITLFRFENDIKDHARIEDKILLPITIDLEEKITG
jgi:regulator of cell morphogenesis and NO signaling